jgi:hypothetical protein
MLATAAVLMLGGAARGQFQPASPSTDIPQVLNTWYTHYLGRNVDQAGMNFWAPRLASQNPQDVLAGILASDEYLNRNGGTPDGLVLGLYRDVLGRTPDSLQEHDVAYWVNKMIQYGSRQAMIGEFLHDANTNIFSPPAVPAAPPAPVAPAQNPWYSPTYTPPAYTAPAPTYIVPAPSLWNWRYRQHERRSQYRYFPYPR